VNKIDTAQACVKKCVEIPSNNTSINGEVYGNKLLECIDAENTNSAKQLETCCGMVSYDGLTCDTSMEDAEQCLIYELSDVKAKAEDYLSCVDAYRDQCQFAGFCVSVLTGGYGGGLMNDFAIGEGTSSANVTKNANTCNDMNNIGSNLCQTVQGCCEICSDKIAGVANAVIDDILLPLYRSTNSTLINCGGNKTCDDYTNSTRKLANEHETVVDTKTINADDSVVVAGLAGECNGNLINGIIIYNETYAVTNYFECIFKKMGKIIAKTESTIIETETSSGISQSFIETYMVTLMVLSTISTIFM